MCINKKTQALTIVLIALSLSGCVIIPAELGISESKWDSYDAEKQYELLSNYEKISQERYELIENKKNNGGDETFLKVDIFGGQAMMPPFIDWYDYKPVSFVVSKGECREIVLKQATNENVETNIGVCFQNKTLYLDPSYYDLTKKNGSISISSSPLWLSGFSYKGISSSGYARLKNVTIKVTQNSK